MAQLATFSEALLDYHQQCTDILKILCENLIVKYVIFLSHLNLNLSLINICKYFCYRKEEASNRPKLEFVPKTLADLHVDTSPSSDVMNGKFFLFFL